MTYYRFPGSGRPTINTGRILFWVAALAVSSYLVTELFTERARGRFLAEKVKSKTAELLSRDAELNKLSLKERDLFDELVKKDKEKSKLLSELEVLKGVLQEKEQAADSANKVAEKNNDRADFLEKAETKVKQHLDMVKKELEHSREQSLAAEEQADSLKGDLERRSSALAAAQKDLESERSFHKKADIDRADAEWHLSRCRNSAAEEKEELQRRLEAQETDKKKLEKRLEEMAEEVESKTRLLEEMKVKGAQESEDEGQDEGQDEGETQQNEE